MRGAIFDWFPTKDDLFLELAPRDDDRVDRYLGVVFDGLILHRAAGFEPPVERVLALVEDTLAPRRPGVTDRRRARTPS